MASFNFSYSVLCDYLSKTLEAEGGHDELIKASLSGSLKTSDKREFLAQFDNLPDTAESRVKILSALLDDVTYRYAKSVKALNGNNLIMPYDLKFSERIIEKIRIAFTLATFNPEILSPKPLFNSFVEEQLGDQAIDFASASKILSTFLEYFKVKEPLEKKGSINKILAILIASL